MPPLLVDHLFSGILLSKDRLKILLTCSNLNLSTVSPNQILGPLLKYVGLNKIPEIVFWVISFHVIFLSILEISSFLQK